jgi:hypothetical protein
MDEEMVQSEEMTEQETSEFEEAFSESGEETGEETALEADQEAEGEESETGEAEEAETEEEEATGEEEKTEEKPQKIVVDGREYTQEEIAQIVSQPPRRYGVLEQLAKDAGKSVDEYLADVEARYEESQIESRTAQLVGQGMEEGLAKHFAETEVENARLKAGAERTQQAEAKRKETQSRTEARMEAEIAEFDRIYPDVREIPPEVFDEISKTGHSPVVAYQNYLLQKQEVELKTLKQDKKNRETTPGAAKGTSKGQPDPFLTELYSED